MNDLRERVARAIKDRVERDGFATHEELADAAIAAGVGAGWRPIGEDTPTTGEQILVGFQGQFAWMSFVANAFGSRTSAPGYAAPTHWQPITPPAPPETGEAET